MLGAKPSLVIACSSVILRGASSATWSSSTPSGAFLWTPHGAAVLHQEGSDIFLVLTRTAQDSLPRPLSWAHHEPLHSGPAHTRCS